MHNCIDPNKVIYFVKAKSDLGSKSVDERTGVDKKKLDGKEIASFYRELIQEKTVVEQPTASTSEEKNPKKLFSVTAVKEGELTERDQRLWFKAAADNAFSSVWNYLERGIDINICDDFGSTALICAAANGSAEVVELLMENGADWTIKSKVGYSAVDIARTKHPEIAHFIESFNDPSKNEKQGTDRDGEVYFCDDCNQHVDDMVAHYSSIVHIVNLSDQPREGYAYGIPVGNIGYQLLKDRGWDESQGLGKEAIGRKYPLKTTLKRDRKGLGLEKLKSRITHFESGDVKAVQVVRKEKVNYFKALDEKKRRDKRIEEEIRSAMRDDYG